MEEKKGTFIHREIGFNFSFTEMQAAIGIAQMKKLSKIIYKKKQINDLYVKTFLILVNLFQMYILIKDVNLSFGSLQF